MVSIASASVAKRTTNTYDVSTTLELVAASGKTIDVAYQVQTNVGTYGGSAAFPAGNRSVTSVIAVLIDDQAGHSTVAVQLTAATNAQIDSAHNTAYLSVDQSNPPSPTPTGTPTPTPTPTSTLTPPGIERRVFVPLVLD